MEINKKTQDLLEKLFEKYRLSGQEVNSYLEGLLVSNYDPYWNYLRLDTLLSLQKPKTGFHDETIFIVYHQITELYFKLILHELDTVRHNPGNAEIFLEAVKRVNRYFRNLIHSFDIMTDGMRPEEFLSFRMALLPASGFQSCQFRLIEIGLTDIIHLVSQDLRSEMKGEKAEKLYEHVYWKKGAIDVESGEKTLTLKQFEMEYDEILFKNAIECTDKNVYAVFRRLLSEGKLDDTAAKHMRELDQNININWRLAHFRSAVRYLHQKQGDVEATGGTNWQKFLPPRFQKVISFPDLWSPEEIGDWGKQWVHDQI